MPPDPSYREQVELLVKALPSVAPEPCFALKGGTAINLFVRDMPRYSVDIDLTYLPIADRRDSLQGIESALRRIAERIRTSLGDVRVPCVFRERQARLDFVGSTARQDPSSSAVADAELGEGERWAAGGASQEAGNLAGTLAAGRNGPHQCLMRVEPRLLHKPRHDSARPGGRVSSLLRKLGRDTLDSLIQSDWGKHMAEVNGAQLMARSLKQQGVDYMFGIVGFPVQGFAAVAQQVGITYVGMRNEQAASYAAHAAGYLTGRPQCCLTVSGPGVIHAFAGLANAKQNCWPMILIGGASPVYQNGMGGFQEERQVELAAPYCKYAHAVEHVHRIPYYVNQAIRHSLYGRPGPVYLDFPDDIIRGECDEDEVIEAATVPEPPRTQADPDAVEAALSAHWSPPNDRWL